MKKKPTWTQYPNGIQCNPDEFVLLQIEETDFGEFFEYAFWVKKGIRTRQKIGCVSHQMSSEGLKSAAISKYEKWKQQDND